MQPPRYDLLIAGGRVLDPGQGIDALTDIAVAGDRIVLIEKGIDGTHARRVLDATGLLVVPGLVDLHTHVAAGLGSLPTDPLAVTPDIAGVFSGVTTVVDAGTAGSANAAGFVDHVAAGARTRVFGFLNFLNARARGPARSRGAGARRYGRERHRGSDSRATGRAPWQ